jgi:hypothetical protein
MKETMNIKIATILGLGILAASGAKAQSVLYSQPFDSGNRSDFSPYWACYDDFTLSGGGTVNKVDWSGLDLGGVTGFTISFWSDNSGTPGTSLASDSITGLAGETFSGQYGIVKTQPIYNYSATLASSFSVAPGTGYYISITANDGDWCWETSGVGNHGALQVNSVASVSINDAGLAFTLEGSTVPEPGAIALGLFGASAFLFRRRKFRMGL